MWGHRRDPGPSEVWNGQTVRSEEPVDSPSALPLEITDPFPSIRPTITATQSQRACSTRVIPPTPAHPFTSASPTKMAPLYFSTRHSTSTTPPTSTRSQAMATLSYSTCQTTVAPPNRTTPSPSTQPSTPATSSMQGSTLMPRTSKKKSTNSQKNSARRRSPVY